MKIFGYRDKGRDYNHGIRCGVVIAESIEEAKEMMHFDDWYGRELFEIPFKKGYLFIGAYWE